MIRRLAVLTLAIGISTLLIGAGSAAADPTPVSEPDAPVEQISPSRLPDHFPADLRQFIGGTDEFKAGPWFTGKCQDHGGDLGLYISKALTAENRLLYWTASEDTKAAMIASSSAGTVGAPEPSAALASARHTVTEGTEPAPPQLPPVFPAGDASYHPPSGTCADDLKRWSTEQWSTWGFQWADAPDPTSLAAMQALPNADTVPSTAWTSPCAEGSADQYCMHAFFVDCGKAERADANRCQDWNLAIGRLFTGTAQWIDQNTGLTDRLGDTLTSLIKATPQYKLGNAYTQAFSWVAGKAGDAVAFVTDPTTVIDDWANSTKTWSLDTTHAVLRGLTSAGDFDPAAGWFLQWYAFSTGIGMIVLVVATLLAITRSRGRGSPKELAVNLFGYLPAGIVMMLFAPLLAQLLIEFMSELSDAITQASGTTVDDLVENIFGIANAVNSDTLVGGSIMGLICFGLLGLGSMSVYVGLLMHQIGLPLAAVVAGIGFGMWVHPSWRKKALRPVLTFIGIALSKPLLFLLIVVTLAGANNALLAGGGGSGDLTSLGQLVLVGASMVVVGLAPWSILRWGPILPTRADSENFGQGGGSASAGVVGGMASTALFRSRSGGGGISTMQARQHSGAASGGPTARSPEFAPHGAGARHPNGGSSESASRGTATSAAGTAGRFGRALATGTVGAAATAGAVAVPIAAQSASAAMNKAKTTADSAPVDSER